MEANCGRFAEAFLEAAFNEFLQFLQELQLPGCEPQLCKDHHLRAREKIGFHRPFLLVSRLLLIKQNIWNMYLHALFQDSET
jgi:hypothetical protein